MKHVKEKHHSPSPPLPPAPLLAKRDERKDPNIVDWNGDDDPENPRNWSQLYKAWASFQLSTMAFAASLGSSIIAPAENTTAQLFGVSTEVATLNISLYIVGFAMGPLCWAPISELWGRRWSMLPAMMCLGIFSIGTAVARNMHTILLTRFFAGVFGSAPVCNVSAALGDLYAPRTRGTATVFYAVCVVGGPTLGPVIGAALINNHHLGWRWTEYIEAICTWLSVALCTLCLPELYAPVILKRKAQRLRKESGNQSLYYPLERQKLDFRSLVIKHFSRPLRMLFTEPMVTAIALYASFVFAMLYITFEVFPIVFLENRHWSPVIAALPFAALFVGVLLAVGINLGNQPRYARISDTARGKPVPEARLAPMAVGGFLFAIGLFWFAWTATPQIHWISPILAIVFIGAGFNVIFQQCVNFLVDTYGMYSASAMSANTFLRSFLAAGFPLAAKPMFRRLGVGPAMSVAGSVAVVAIPVPFLFMRYGLALRKMSKFAPVVE